MYVSEKMEKFVLAIFDRVPSRVQTEPLAKFLNNFKIILHIDQNLLRISTYH